MLPRRRFLGLLCTLFAFPAHWRPAVARTPGLHLVDGWVLTAADLDAIGLHDR